MRNEAFHSDASLTRSAATARARSEHQAFEGLTRSATLIRSPTRAFVFATPCV
jgi:hypothetical protein